MQMIILILMFVGLIVAILTLVFVDIQRTETFKAIDRRIAEKIERRK